MFRWNIVVAINSATFSHISHKLQIICLLVVKMSSKYSTVPFIINTLVFFDLETTGLLNDSPAKITELHFCSIERNQFIDCSNQGKLRPRVTNRLNLCLNPCRSLHSKAAEISNLNIDILQHQTKFDIDVFQNIFSFLNRLKKPICLVAHRGSYFDFPILKSELEKIGKVWNLFFTDAVYVMPH